MNNENIKTLFDIIALTKMARDPSTHKILTKSIDDYPCDECKHYTGNGNCGIGVGFKCITDPKSYWEPKKEKEEPSMNIEEISNKLFKTKNKRCTIRLTEFEYSILKESAAKLNMTMSDYIRAIIFFHDFKVKGD